MKKIDFYKACEVPTSNFDLQYAKLNMHWMIAKKIYELKDYEGEIPLYLHFIWLGSKMPKEYEEIIDGWKQHNPNHKVFIWGDEEVNKLLKEESDEVRALYSQCTNFGQKSDIARYIILSKIGGVYSDIDFVCLDNIEDLHEVNFFAGICLEKEFQLNNGLMGSVKNHPIIHNAIQGIDLKGYDNISCPHTRTLYQTGPWVITEAAKKYVFDAEELPSDILFMPSNYFHPFPAVKRFDGDWKKYVKDYTKCVHLWKSSWQNKQQES